MIVAAVAGAISAMAAPIQPNVSKLPNPVAVEKAMFGMAVAGIGDVNGDGVGDVVVGALGQEKVFVYSGATRGLIRTIIDPEGLTGHRFGLAVAGVGDWNGDGVEDLGVGSPGEDQSFLLPCVDPNQPCVPQPFQGRVFIFSGATGSLLKKLLPPGNEFLAYGFAIVAAGDLDGDGKTDVVVGSPTRRPNLFGQVFAFKGGDGAMIWKSAEATHQTLASFGQYLASIADLNADGKRDLLVDAPFHDYDPTPNGFVIAGRGYVLSGADGSIVRAIDNPSPADNEAFGTGLTGISDETGDGIEEYALGDPVQGKVFVYRGDNGAAIRTITSPGNPATDFFGFPLARVEDRDGDGLSDLWVSASRGGRIDLTSAKGGRLLMVADPTPGAVEMDGGFGRALASTSDLGGDGLRDLVAGEPAEPVGSALNAGAAFLIINNRPPVALCQSVTRSADASCLAAVTPQEIDAGSSDPDGDPLSFELIPQGPFGLGANAVTLKVKDDKGASATCAATVTDVDTTPPSITGASASPGILWPPNHKMVPVTVDYTVADNCDGAAAIVCSLSVASSEVADGLGDGQTSPDTAVVDAHHVRQRAERSGKGPGRTYTITINCADAASNTTSAQVEVKVPHGRAAN